MSTSPAAMVTEPPIPWDRRRKLNDAMLVELRARNLPRCVWTDVLQTKEGEALDAGDAAALDDYFRIFLPLSETCVLCGTTQGGLRGALLGGFTWGIANGEGHCATCGYPARAHHRNFGPIEFLPAILQYHPDELKTKEERRR